MKSEGKGTMFLLMNCKPSHINISHSVTIPFYFLYRFSTFLLPRILHFWPLMYVVHFVIADAYISGIIQIYNVIAIFNTKRNRYTCFSQ